jgi:hypothetical protein
MERTVPYHSLNEWYILCAVNCLPATKRIQIIKETFCTDTNVQYYIQQTLAYPVTVNPDRNMKKEKFCSQLSTYFKRHMGFRSKRTFRLC